jgi:glycerophosphoryl diester phosphodiesterase
MRPIVIAHRGASGYLPEHTLPAKALAHAMGADYLEQDVVATRDDELVVLHDIHLDRVTDVAAHFPDRARRDGRYYVRDFDMDEIRQLKVHERRDESGAPVYPMRFASADEPFCVHTLAEEIRFVQELNERTGRVAGIYPEIKAPGWHKKEGVDIAPQLLEVLQAYGYTEHSDPVYVQCFDHDEVRRLRKDLGTQLKLICLLGKKPPRDLAALAEYSDGIGPWIETLYVRSGSNGDPVAGELVAAAHAGGLAVHPYTFRSDDLPPGFATLGELVDYCVGELNIDGLFTDFPDRVKNLLIHTKKNT